MSNLQNSTNPVSVKDNQTLKTVISSLLQEEFVTLDTEFVRETTYWPDLCLVQLASSKGVFIIDALEDNLDLSLLEDLLDNSSIVKVFHAAQQDLEIFFHRFGKLPKPIFDTQIAAMVAGFGNQISYDQLVKSLTGVSIDKSHRFSNWTIRPLTQAQLAYAAADVTYLRDVYEILYEQVEVTKRLEWVSTEMEVLSDPIMYHQSVEKIWKRLRPKTNNRRLLGILYAIIQWREEEAQRVNIPRQYLLRDESLLEIAAVKPQTVKALSRIRNVSAEFAAGQIGVGLLSLIKRIEKIAVDELSFPSLVKREYQKPSEALLALLKVLLIAKCETYKVAPKLVASSKDIEHFAGGERDLPIMKGWRREVFGEDALALCDGQLILGVKDHKIEFVKRRLMCSEKNNP